MAWLQRRSDGFITSITTKMAQRGHIREVLDKACEEEGCARAAAQQSAQGLHDEAWILHHNRRAAYLRGNNVCDQRACCSSCSSASHPTAHVSSYNTIWPSKWNDASPTSSTSTYTCQTIPCAAGTTSTTRGSRYTYENRKPHSQQYKSASSFAIEWRIATLTKWSGSGSPTSEWAPEQPTTPEYTSTS